jgi:hypothetical protein
MHLVSSRQGKHSKTGSKDGHDMDHQVKKTFDGIFNQQNVAMASECHLFGIPRCIFTLSQGEDNRHTVKATHRYLNKTIPLQCGMPLFAVDPDSFLLSNEIHVQHVITCAMEVTIHYYAARTSSEMPSVCVHCGTKMNLVTDHTPDKD